MLAKCMSAVLVMTVGLIGCDSDESDKGTSEPGAGTTASGGGAGSAEKLSGGADPTLGEGTRTHLDLIALAHLADVDLGGLFIDFGTPARMKYTVGRWHNDWGRDGAAGERTFTNLKSSAVVYFPVDEPSPLTARIRLRKVGTASLVLYLNGETLRTVDLGDGLQSHDVSLPAELLHNGENKLRIRATGTTTLAGEEVSIELDSIHFLRGAVESAPPPPNFGALVADMEIGGVTRKALSVSGGTSLSFYVDVPEAGQLLLGLGATAAGATAKITVTPAEGESQEILASDVGTTFRDLLLPLTPWAGKIVRLDLVTEGATEVRVGWATPRIIVPLPDRARIPGQAKNVIVLTIDTLRAEKLRPYNPRTRVRTPVFDAMAADATLFERAQAPENWTKPSVASILTSLHPTTHNTKADSASLPSEALTLGEVYQQGGFRTATFLANGYVSDKFGFNQGWHHYTNYIRENRSTEAAHVFGEAAEWIEEHKDERFFVYIQTIDPHVPYDPPDDYLQMYDANAEAYSGQIRNRSTGNLLGEAKKSNSTLVFTEADQQRLRDLHDAEISYHDHHFGVFLTKLRELGLYEDLVFVVTSDHGEEFNEHGSWGHGHSVYQELLHVPLVVRWPAAQSAGLRVPQTVSTMDIGPTILEATGMAVPEPFEGRSLVGFMRAQPPVGPAVAFSDFLDDRRVITAGRWKLILRGNLRWTMFDLEQDPGEQHQLDGTAANPIALRYLRILQGQFLGAGDLRNWLYGTGSERPSVLPQQDSQIDAEMCRQLQLLGYVDARCDAP